MKNVWRVLGVVVLLQLAACGVDGSLTLPADDSVADGAKAQDSDDAAT